MTAKQDLFDFMGDNKQAIKGFNDQDLIKKYNKVCLGMAKRIDELEACAHHQQAKIEGSMLEYCPNEMTVEQIKTWEDAQVRA